MGATGSTLRRDSGQVATGVERRPGAGTVAGPPTVRCLQAASWSKGVTQTGCIFPPQPRPAASPNFLLDLSLSLFSFDVPKEDAAAQPRWLLVPPTHPVSRAAAGWRNPLRTTGLSGWQVRGSWAGGRKSEADEEGRGRVTYTSGAPSASPCSPGREISFGGIKPRSSDGNRSVAPRAGCKSLKWQRG